MAAVSQVVRSLLKCSSPSKREEKPYQTLAYMNHVVSRVNPSNSNTPSHLQNTPNVDTTQYLALWASFRNPALVASYI